MSVRSISVLLHRRKTLRASTSFFDQTSSHMVDCGREKYSGREPDWISAVKYVGPRNHGTPYQYPDSVPGIRCPGTLNLEGQHLTSPTQGTGAALGCVVFDRKGRGAAALGISHRSAPPNERNVACRDVPDCGDFTAC